MKRSPAPWTGEQRADGAIDIQAQDGSWPLKVYAGDANGAYPRSVVLGNAALCIAAPELLEALTELVGAMIDYGMEVEDEPPHRHVEMMNRATAALAKATGGAG